MISTPSSSSPWIAPLSQRAGPGSAPLSTSAFRWSHSPVVSRATRMRTPARSPGGTVVSPI